MKNCLKVFLMTFILMLFIPFSARANPYPVGGVDGSGAEWSNCTWSVWKLVHSSLGTELPGWGNAGQWYNNAANAGYSVGKAPAVNSIKVTSGHVAFVTDISADKNKVYVKEGGYNYKDGTHLRYHEGWVTAYPSDLKGYIYLETSADITPVDMGDNFIALILRSDIWKPIIVNGGIVECGIEKGNANEYYRFSRQSDGSYIIKSLWSNCVLDVFNFQTTNGTYVNAGQQSVGDNSAQRWYITGNGTYSLVPKCAVNMSLTVDGVGKRTSIWDNNGWKSQIFSIYKVSDNIGITQISAQYKSKIHIGQENQIHISYTPSNAKFYGVKYISSDNSVATVNSSGIISGKRAGSVKISCVSTFNENVNYEFSITVSNHNYKKEIVNNAKCLKNGLLEITCFECNSSYTQTIPATGHSYGAWIEKTKATYTTTGKQERVCLTCRYREVKGISKLIRINITTASISSIKQKTYSGKTQKPSITVKYKGKLLKYNHDYTLAYDNTKYSGSTAMLTKLKGNTYYYVKIRSYKTIGVKKIYGPYCTVKKVRTR